jgi:hypothetical protein
MSVAMTWPVGPTRSASQSHGAPARADLKAPLARLDHFTPPARGRVEDTFQETQPIVFGLLGPSRVEPVTRPEIHRLSDSGSIL